MCGAEEIKVYPTGRTGNEGVYVNDGEKDLEEVRHSEGKSGYVGYEFDGALPNIGETLGDPYYKRVPLPRDPEYRNLSQDSQLTKPSVKFATVEPNIISDYPNGYCKIFGRSRLPITPSCE